MTVAEANKALARYCVQIVRVSEWRGVSHYRVQNVAHGGPEHIFRSPEEAVRTYLGQRAYSI